MRRAIHLVLAAAVIALVLLGFATGPARGAEVVDVDTAARLASSEPAYGVEPAVATTTVAADTAFGAPTGRGLDGPTHRELAAIALVTTLVLLAGIAWVDRSAHAHRALAGSAWSRTETATVAVPAVFGIDDDAPAWPGLGR